MPAVGRPWPSEDDDDDDDDGDDDDCQPVWLSTGSMLGRQRQRCPSLRWSRWSQCRPVSTGWHCSEQLMRVRRKHTLAPKKLSQVQELRVVADKRLLLRGVERGEEWMLPSGHWTPPLISDNLGLFNSLLIEIALTIITAHVYVIIQVLLLLPPLSSLWYKSMQQIW